MSDTGNPLRQARESKNLTLADVEAATRIKARYLEALEEGRWDDLPGPVQARGFLKNYAAFLGINCDGLMMASAREVNNIMPPAALPPKALPPMPQPAAPPPAVPPPLEPAQTRPANIPEPPTSPPKETARTPEPPFAQPAAQPPSAQPSSSPTLEERINLPPWLSIDMIVGGIALALFVIVALLAARSYVIPLVSKLAAPPPTPTGVAVTRPQAAFTPTSTITPTAVFPVNPNGGIQIGLAAMEHAWVRITTDGVTAFEGLIAPGQSLTWDAKEQLIVETGNGAAFNYAVNGKSMGSLGARDQVVIRAWSPRGEVVPPATPTPAPPTETPEPAPTLVPTPSSNP